jgi:DNA polymerase III epsilon subunit-like protein
VQFCGKVFKGGKELKSMNVFINPGLPIPQESSRIHNIFDEDVKNAPTFEEIGPSILKLLHEAELWSAFNGLGFDVDAMISECLRCDLPFYGRPMIDPLIWEREERGKFKGNKQSDVAKRRGCSIISEIMSGGDRKLHNAETDVDILASIVDSMAPELPYCVGRLIEKQTEFKIKQDKYAAKIFGPKK